MIAMIVKRAYYFLSSYFRSVFFFCFFVHTGGGRSGVEVAERGREGRTRSTLVLITIN